MASRLSERDGLSGFCDMECRYARFPESDDVDGSRSCRTFVAIYCSAKKSLVHKNIPCPNKKERPVKKHR